jgi:hypothetical protein
MVLFLRSSCCFLATVSWQVGNSVFIPTWPGRNNPLSMCFGVCVHGPFLEIIMLFSSCSKDSLYPTSRSRATMELSPHPHDIRVRSLHMNVSWQVDIPIVKDSFLTEVVIRDVRNWFLQKPSLKLINLCLRWWDSDFCLVESMCFFLFFLTPTVSSQSLNIFLMWFLEHFHHVSISL